MRGKELIIALSISLGIAIAILSLPDILEPIAREMLLVLGVYWPLAIFIIGIVHGLKPDEHTWPITVSYGIMQRNVRGAMASTGVFAGGADASLDQFERADWATPLVLSGLRPGSNSGRYSRADDDRSGRGFPL